MRTFIFVVAVVATSAAIPGQSRAQNYPWCAQYAGAGGGARNCGFVSYGQCMETLQGMGGFCEQNTLYVAPASNVERAAQRKRKSG